MPVITEAINLRT